jgi:transmembrane protein EpsG
VTHIVFLLAIALSLPIFKKRTFIFFTFIILFLFQSFRFDFGNDYLAYQNMHYLINMDIQTYGDGDMFFKYFSLFIPNFYMFIATIGLIYSLVFYLLITKNLEIKYYWFGVFILLINPYLFLIHLSGLRQTMAILILIAGINFLIKRKPVLWAIFVFFAAGFHQSALFMLPIYFLVNQKQVSTKNIYIVLVLVLVLVFSPLFEKTLPLVVDLFPRYNYYIENIHKNSLRSVLLSSFFFFLILFNITKLSGKELIFGKLSLIATIISLLTFKLGMITRVGMYFDVYLIVAIPIIFSKIGSKYKLLLFGMMFAIYFLRYVSFFSTPLWEPFHVYKTIL